MRPDLTRMNADWEYSSFRATQRMDKNGDTRFALSLHLRQRLIERTFENTLATEYNTQPRHQHELVSYQVDDSQEYAVTAKIKDLSSGEVYEIKS